jgi:hypothetical protein
VQSAGENGREEEGEEKRTVFEHLILINQLHLWTSDYLDIFDIISYLYIYVQASYPYTYVNVSGCRPAGFHLPYVQRHMVTADVKNAIRNTGFTL